MTLREYGRLVGRRVWLVLLLVTAMGIMVFWYKQQQPPLYRSTTTLVLKPATENPSLYQGPTGMLGMANNYAAMMRTQAFARRVGERLGMALPEDTILQSLSAAYVSGTPFFQVAAVHTDPALTRRIAQAAAEVVISENIVRQVEEQRQRTLRDDPRLAQQQATKAELQSTLEQDLRGIDAQISEVRAQLNQRGPQGSAADQQRGLRAELDRLRLARINTLGMLTSLRNPSMAVMQEVTFDTAEVLDVASLPTGRLPRGTVPAVLGAMLVGLVTGLGLTLLLAYLDRSIKRPDDLAAIYRQAPLAVIGQISSTQQRAPRHHLLEVIQAPRSPTSEALRALRTGIQFAALGRPIRSVLVTSAVPGEGKSFVSANLAAMFATGGLRVALVDADLRKPTQHLFHAMPCDRGFSDLLLDPQQTIEDVIRPTTIPGLWLLPCGTLPENPSELLGSARAQQVMAALVGQVDLVIFDTPPAATVTDATVLAHRVDAVLQVVGAGATDRTMVHRCKTLLEHSGVRLLPPVLNRVQMGDLGAYSGAYAQLSTRRLGTLLARWEWLLRRSADPVPRRG